MNAPAAVLALVLVMTAVGASALLWAAPTWGAVRHGYEVLTGTTVALIAWAAWAALGAPVASLAGTVQSGAGETARTLVLAVAVLNAVAVVVLLVKLPPVIARIAGLLSAAGGVAAFVPVAAIRSGLGGSGGVVQGVAELALGALLLGAVWVGMVLGHWYLVERRLSNRYMVWIAWVNVAAVVAGLGSVLLSWRSPAPCEGLAGAAFEQCATTFAPVLRIGAMTVVLGVGVLALIAVIAAFNVRLAKEGGRSIQASTGMFYLAVILAPAVEFAAKVRFF